MALPNLGMGKLRTINISDYISSIKSISCGSTFAIPKFPDMMEIISR